MPGTASSPAGPWRPTSLATSRRLPRREDRRLPVDRLDARGHTHAGDPLGDGFVRGPGQRAAPGRRRRRPGAHLQRPRTGDTLDVLLVQPAEHTRVTFDPVEQHLVPFGADLTGRLALRELDRALLPARLDLDHPGAAVDEEVPPLGPDLGVLRRDGRRP